ncbi:hypothetical protein FNV43_RR21692 [Rhamnella rubrinervis]|uniref:Uncharacterized protein n=1 Tax=Rhamnella rubrinervis TaxID=2594499 RepID=A0A8K0GMF9_9ROSA|nr:hypothetical protein FNV43_RR21692 [Rhamnella rubrinervis]
MIPIVFSVNGNNNNNGFIEEVGERRTGHSASPHHKVIKQHKDMQNGRSSLPVCRMAGPPCQSTASPTYQMAGPCPNSPSQHKPAKFQVIVFYLNSPAKPQGGPAIWQVVNCLVEHKKYHAHLTNNSNLDRAIDIIKNKLRNGMDKLLASWIEKFFEIKIIQFCGGFIHHLLLHQVDCEDKYVMEFDFNGIGARFDRKCFAMITGLNWLFGKCGPMTQGKFSKAFEDLDFDKKEVADNVKCCMLYFLETLLLGGDKKRLMSILIVAIIGPCGKYHGSNWILRMLAWSYPSILQYTKLATVVFDLKDGTKDASQSEFQYTLRLEMQIEEIRSELPLSNMSTVPVWDPFTPIDPTERAALFAFIVDPSTTVHLGDYDALEKSSFELILTNGSWLGDLEMDAALFYIRRRMINSPQMYDHRAIVTDCMFWSSIHARYTKYLKEQSEHTMDDEEEDELSDTVN